MSKNGGRARATLTEEQVADIRAAAAEGGLTLQAIAERFGTSRQHVSRIVRGEQRQSLPGVDVEASGSVIGATIAMLENAGFDPNENVGAATAIALAEKLDAVCGSDTAQSAIAAPGLARALAETLAEIGDSAAHAGPRLGALRGEEAVLVARELGYPNPENVDVERFDQLETIRLKRHRRLAAQRAAASQ